MTALKVYDADVSDEPLDIIRANECEASPGLATSRFRRLWNELAFARRLVTLRQQEIDRIREEALLHGGPDAPATLAQALRRLVALGRARRHAPRAVEIKAANGKEQEALILARRKADGDFQRCLNSLHPLARTWVHETTPHIDAGAPDKVYEIASTATPIPEPTRAAVAFIRRTDGRMLCVWNRRYGGWSLPGGKVEAGETPELAVARELAEETGLRIEPWATEAIFEGAHGIEVDGRRGSYVHIFRVIHPRGSYSKDVEPREMEIGCPVTWLTREEFQKWSPFAAFYERVWSAIDSRPERRPR